jgi:hypothetical protein
MVRMHQLLDACARSAIVRERYRGLVEMSIASLTGLIPDQEHAQSIATLLLAIIIGAQTMTELGVAVDADALARTALSLFDAAQ